MNRQVPWLRVFVEGVVIVGSILLAFGLQAWWDGVQARATERSYLLSLGEEFRQARPQPMRERSIRYVAALIDQTQGERLAEPDSLYRWTTGLSQQIEFDPPRAVFDDLVSAGATQLIRSDSLRRAFARYSSRLAALRDADAQAWATWEQRIQPFLEGRVPRLERLRNGGFGAAPDLGVPFGPSRHAAQWEEVLRSAGFEDMLVERWMRLRLAKRRYDDIVELSEETLRLIAKELEDLG